VTILTTKPQALALSGSNQPPPLRSEQAGVESHEMSSLYVQAGVKHYEFTIASQLSHIRALHSLALLLRNLSSHFLCKPFFTLQKAIQLSK